MTQHEMDMDAFATIGERIKQINSELYTDEYNVAKYLPFGPVRDVMPYLIRRAQENTSVAGQTGRELALIISERNRRKLK